jgi:hypothetical protein
MLPPAGTQMDGHIHKDPFGRTTLRLNRAEYPLKSRIWNRWVERTADVMSRFTRSLPADESGSEEAQLQLRNVPLNSESLRRYFGGKESRSVK